MRKIIEYGLVFTWSLALLACSSDNKKPDAVVVANEEKANQATSPGADIPDTTDLTAAYQDTSIENYTLPAAENNEVDNKASANESPVTASDRRNAVATANPAETKSTIEKRKPEPEGKANSKVPVRPVVRTRLSVQQQLARDARLASQMPLAKFGRYMERRTDYYRSFGEVSYDDKTVEIKISREELKIQTPEGKYKRESDERKIKTAAGKFKEETRR